MRRKTKHDYRQPGSLERCEEAALALADVSSEDDVAWHRARARFRAAILAFHFDAPRRGRRDRPEQPALPFRR
jgi:hypothetical protein